VPTTAPTESAPVTESTIVESLPKEADAEEIVTYLQDLTTDDLADLTDTQTKELIASIADTELTDEQAEQIAEALSDAPAEVKQQFEQTINVFSGQFDTYIPDGSTISVGARRAVVAVTAVSFLLPAPAPTTRRRI
jgi:ferritin-like protein